MELIDLFPKEHIFTVKSNEKQLVIKEMIQKLEELGKLKNADRYYAQVIHRESLENTGIGSGFAIPHARTDSVKDLCTVFGILQEPIDYQSYDNEPVQYVMLSIFPTSMSTKYLYLVGMMARIFSNKEKRVKIDEARTPAKIYTALNREAKNYFESISEHSDAENEIIDNLAGVPSSDLDLLIRLDRLYSFFEGQEPDESTRKKIDELRKLIDNRSLTYYERMRKKCQNPFAILEKNTCSGCHMVIPPADMSSIKELKRIAVCTYCGRFLIVL